MNTVEPIRDRKKILAIKANLKAQSNPRDYLLFTMGINFALRISDLLRLKARDVLDEKGDIKDYIYLREQKTKKEKKLKLNEAVKEVLEYYFSKAQITNPDQLLFVAHRSRKPLTRIRAWQLIRLWCEKVGLSGERFGTHTLRKTWGYIQRTKHGVGFEIICKRFNHSSPSVTMRYLGIQDKEVHDTLMNEIG